MSKVLFFPIFANCKASKPKAVATTKAEVKPKAAPKAEAKAEPVKPSDVEVEAWKLKRSQ